MMEHLTLQGSECVAQREAEKHSESSSGFFPPQRHRNQVLTTSSEQKVLRAFAPNRRTDSDVNVAGSGLIINNTNK